MPGHQLPYASVERLLAADVTESEIFGQEFFRERGPNFRMAQQRFDFRGKGEDSVVVEVIERLNAKPIASAKERLAIAVPNGKRKHTPELLNTSRTILLVGVDDRFRVAPGDVLVTGSFEFRPDGRVIEDFAVKCNPLRPVLVGHGLVTAGYVDDTETAMP
jgi:hypothetical protein